MTTVAHGQGTAQAPSAPTPAELAAVIARLSAYLEAQGPPAWLELPGIRNAVETLRDRAAVAWLRRHVHQQWDA